MSEKQSELNALIELLDDPDESIFNHVVEKLTSMGKDVIPALESAWEHQPLGAQFQLRIEKIIHSIFFEDVTENLAQWHKNNQNDVLEALIIIAQYQYPHLDKQEIYSTIEKLEQEIWLELNNNLTALEQVRIINHILFEVHQFSGNTANYHDPKNSFINIVLESKKGNPIMLSVIYAIIAQRLKLPIYGVNLPKHFVLAYCGTDGFFLSGKTDENNVLFYINPFSQGGVFSQKEVNDFLDKMNLPQSDSFTKPCRNIDIVKRILNNLWYAYKNLGYPDKVAEIETLQKIIEPVKQS